MKKKTAVIVVSFLLAAVAALGTVSLVQYRRATEYERYTAQNFQHAFDELVTSVGEMDAALQKSLYATTASMSGAVYTELFGKAMTAQMSLGVLPFSSQELEQTSGFISRVGDYAFALSRSAARGEICTDEQRENLRALSDTASVMSQNLLQLQADMNEGKLTMDELGGMQSAAENAAGSEGNTLGGSMRLIEKEFPEVPSLIYDGPFSEHLTGISPKMLENEAEVDENEARRRVSAFLGIQNGRVYPCGKSEGSIPAYLFAADISGGQLYAEVSVKGGEIISLVCSRTPYVAELSTDEALGKAREFLERKGFTDMTESYYTVSGNILTVNYAWQQDGVICYSDLIKVGVALDNGSIVGFEARGYITTHYERELPEVTVSAEQARQLVAPGLKVLSEGLALVPTDGKYEIMCHEFKCETEDGQHYIIYVNAVTGEQEKILILIEDENGTLTL